MGTKQFLIHEDVLANSTMIEKQGVKVGFRTQLSNFFKVAKKRNRNVNPIAPNQADIVPWLLWDRIVVAAGGTFAAQYNFFTSPIGSGTKTKIDTNMEQVMRLPDPQWYNATHLGFFFNPNINAADLQAVLGSYFAEFWVGQKIYSEGPVQHYPGGVGTPGNAATTVAATTINNLTNGTPALGNMQDLRLPQGLDLGNGNITDGLIGVTILQGQSFKVSIQGTSFVAAAAPAPGVVMYCAIPGILSRGVQ